MAIAATTSIAVARIGYEGDVTTEFEHFDMHLDEIERQHDNGMAYVSDCGWELPDGVRCDRAQRTSVREGGASFQLACRALPGSPMASKMLAPLLQLARWLPLRKLEARATMKRPSAIEKASGYGIVAPCSLSPKPAWP